MQQLSLMGFPVVICRADYLKSISYTAEEELLQSEFLERNLSLAEAGCLNSHNTIYKHMLRSDHQLAVILEDDAILGKEFKNVIEGLQNCQNLFQKPTIISLYYISALFNRFKRVIKISRVLDPTWISLRIKKTAIPTYGTVAYVITREACENALSNTVRYTSTADWPIEWIGKVEFYSVLEPVVFHPTLQNSLIEETRVKPAISIDRSNFQFNEEPVAVSVRIRLIGAASLGKRLLELVKTLRNYQIPNYKRIVKYKIVLIAQHRLPKVMAVIYDSKRVPLYEGFGTWRYHT